MKPCLPNRATRPDLPELQGESYAEAWIMATARGAAEIDRGEWEDFDDILRDLDAIIEAAELDTRNGHP